MSRKYQPIWEQLKKTGSAVITVSKDNARTVENGVKELKTGENVINRKLGGIGWSKLVIKREPISANMVRITFSFLYSTNI